MRGRTYGRGELQLSLVEHRVPVDRRLRAVCKLKDMALRLLSAKLDALYADSGRPSIAIEYIRTTEY
jgi:hypothetical protein